MQSRVAHWTGITSVIIGCLSVEQSASACASCGCVVNQPAGTLSSFRGNEIVQGPTLRIALDALTSQSSSLSAHGTWESVVEHRWITAVAWSPVQRLTFMASVPLALRAFDDGGPAQLRVAPGDSDLSVSVHVLRTEVRAGTQHQLTLSVGLSLPTGPVAIESSGLFAPFAMQTGSGSWDFLPSVSFTTSTLRWSWISSVRGRVATPGYHQWLTGHSLMLSTGPAFVFDAHFTGIAAFESRLALGDQLDGQFVSGTGGVSVQISPAMLITLSEVVSLKFALHVPIGRWTPSGNTAENVSASVGMIISPPLRQPSVRPVEPVVAPARDTNIARATVRTNTY